MKNPTHTAGIIGLCLLIVLLGTPLIVISAGHGELYETDDVADYGEFIGNYDNETPAEFIAEFFPDEIQDNFTDVAYHYAAKKDDTYACECYLEFVIEDKADFLQFMAHYSPLYEVTESLMDKRFQEYSVSNVLDLDWTRVGKENGYPIQYARVGKILFSPNEQRCIFLALCVWDGGGVDTNELHYFFDRIQIDIIDYQLNAFVFESDQAEGITYQERYDRGLPTFYPYPKND